MDDITKPVNTHAGAESELNDGLERTFTTVVAEGMLESWLEPHHIPGVERGSLKPFVCAIARREDGACSVMTVLEGAILALNGKHITISITVRPNDLGNRRAAFAESVLIDGLEPDLTTEIDK